MSVRSEKQGNGTLIFYTIGSVHYRRNGQREMSPTVKLWAGYAAD